MCQLWQRCDDAGRLPPRPADRASALFFFALLLLTGCTSLPSPTATSPIAASPIATPPTAASPTTIAPSMAQPVAVTLASHLADVVPPKIELPEWQAAKIDWSFFDPTRYQPSNDRDWIDEQRVLAEADIAGDQVRIHNIRDAQFFTYRDAVIDYYDRAFDLTKIKSVDFLMVPFAGNRAIAHTMLSFGFEGGDQVGVSVEVRLEQGESYSTVVGLMGQYELMYVLADERDLLVVRPEFRGVDVLLYRTTATPAQVRALFLDVLKRVNQLHDHPEFYDTLRNNCTTNIVRHVNDLVPGRVPYDYRVLLPGYSDELAYDLGLIDNSLPFAEVRRRARITDLILKYKDDPHFSERIRGE